MISAITKYKLKNKIISHINNTKKFNLNESCLVEAPST